MEGGFSSLKLTKEFYKSETAARIFQKIYGVKEFHFNLDPITVENAIIADRMDMESKIRKKSVGFHSDLIQNTVRQSFKEIFVRSHLQARNVTFNGQGFL